MAKPTIAVIGDSLAQGFQRAAIHYTSWAYPANIARWLGLEVPMDFRVMSLPGPGFPLNIEDFLRRMQDEFGDHLSLLDWIVRFPALLRRYTTELSATYVHGPASEPSSFRGVYHNL